MALIRTTLRHQEQQTSEVLRTAPAPAPAASPKLQLECKLLKANHDLTWARNNLQSAKFRKSLGADEGTLIDYFAECESQALDTVRKLEAAIAAL